MKFAPKPENDFASFIRTYYDECRGRFDGIEAIAGKWTFRDLMPGMSDFDTRFICRDGMAADDWRRMAIAVGEAHLRICERHPSWARNLEHTPGINITWEELTYPESYYPEYQQWTFYHAEAPEKLAAALNTLEKRPWDAVDEYFHLKKFCLYYGRYNRTIDPGCNMSLHANKYPLHSRLMHYFAPPVQSAVCLMERRNLPGKFDAIELAERRFSDLACWGPVWEILHADYETPEWYEEPKLTELEDALEAALVAIAEGVREAITLVPASVSVDIPKWKESLKQIELPPALAIFDSAKWARLFKGRLLFYAKAPWYFDPIWCIENELHRVRGMFFSVPFGVYWRMRTGRTVHDPIEILDELLGDPLSADDVAAAKEFAQLTSGPWEPGKEREAALAIAGVFDAFYGALHKIGEGARGAGG